MVVAKRRASRDHRYSENNRILHFWNTQPPGNKIGSIMSEPLIRIQNHHALACGDPPIISSDNMDLYIGYFENRHGDQWIFTYHRKTTKAELLGGDAGWNTRNEVTDGVVPSLSLNAEESKWLKACWLAATAG
jgi:hypothetical protein